MTESTYLRIPQHLRKYAVEQNYDRYTTEDQAVWRHIMRRLKNFLAKHAHESYLSGLNKTGINVDAIPKISDIDQHMSEFGWGAIPVSGFIPPAAFMEFQSLGILPIASDMRTLDHLLYTPAPDIVHEAAGHAPILANPEYAAYLKKYGEIARHSILTKEDLDQYEAIRVLSDIKEDPRSTKAEIGLAEKRLNQINLSIKNISEAAFLSRMNWWTAEYGLIGDISDPKIYGAGLLSSVGESKTCLDLHIKKIPLSVDCVDFSYDITEPQPQLFVAKDFAQLSEVLEELAKRLAFKRGGPYGLTQAKASRTVNTIQLNSGLQVSGILADFWVDQNNQPIFFKMTGATQLATQYQELVGHGISRHPDGFSSPIGYLKNNQRCLSTFNRSELASLGLKPEKCIKLTFANGVTVEGRFLAPTFVKEHLILLTFDNCTVKLGDQTLFEPSWGEFDMAVGSQVPCVFGGPADREHFGQIDDFVAKHVPKRSYSISERDIHSFFEETQQLRNHPNQNKLNLLCQRFLGGNHYPWLAGLELIEIADCNQIQSSQIQELRLALAPKHFASPVVRTCIEEGLAISKLRI